MKRIWILMGVLLLLLVTLLPYTLYDGQNRQIHAEFDQTTQEIALLQAKLGRLRAVEEELITLEWGEAALSTRLIGADPFAQMERELMGAAAAADLKVDCLELTGAALLQELPRLAAYGATIGVSGATDRFIAFLHLLEGHPLLIEIPDLALEWKVTDAPVVDQSTMPLQTTLALRFFRSFDPEDRRWVTEAPALKSVGRCDRSR